MLENITLIAVSVIFLWGIGFALYFRASYQHNDLQADIDSLQEALQEEDTSL